MKRLLLALALLAFPTLALAQNSTTLSGTVQDTDAQLWFAGYATASFVPAPGTSLGQYTWAGGAFNPGVAITANMNSSGVYSLSLPSNTAIVPGNSRWTITVSSGSTSLATQSQTLVITGATQTQNFTPGAVRISAGPNAVAYADPEVSANVGQSYYQLNVTASAGSTRVCQVATNGVCSTWAGITGGVSGVLPPGTINPGSFGVNMNGNLCAGVGVTMTNGVTTVGCTSAQWCDNVTTSCTANRTNVVGMNTFGTNGAGGVLASVTGAVVMARTTIVSVPTPTTAIVAVAPTITCSASAACFLVVAPLEDTAWTAVDTAVTNALNCSTVMFPTGITMIKEPHFNTVSNACASYGTSLNVRNSYVCEGYATCTFVLAPDFDWPACTFGLGGNGCLFAQTYPHLVAFTVTGAGAGLSGQTHNNVIINPFVAFSQRLMLSDFASAATSTIGYVCNVCVNDAVVIDGFGKTSMAVGGGPYNWSNNSFYGDSAGPAIDFTAASVTLYSRGDQLGSTTGTVLVNMVTGTSDSFVTTNLNAIGGTAASGQAIFINGANNYAEFFGENLTNVSANSYAIGCASGIGAHLKNLKTFAGGAGGGGFYTQSTCKIWDDGNAQLASTTPSAATFVVGSFVPFQSVQGACTGVGTASSTLGLFPLSGAAGATTCTVATPNLSPVVMNHPGTLSVLQVTATAAGTNAASGVVTVLKNGAGTALTCTIGTATSCFDTTHTATFVNGDLISINFTTQVADTLAGVKAVVSAY